MTVRSVVEAVLAVAALLGGGWSWQAAHAATTAEPVVPGQPSMPTTSFFPPLIALALALVTVAGVLAVLAVAHRRAR